MAWRRCRRATEEYRMKVSLRTVLIGWVVPVAGAAARRRRALLIGWVIVAATVVSYIPAIQSGFIWDDDHLLWRNETIKADDGLYQFWCSKKAPDYYPITWSTFWVEWRLFGDRGMGYHISNVIQHAIGALLVWAVLRTLKIPGAWVVGLIFALHPVNIASVAWISEMKNTLSIIFYLVAVLLYLKFDDKERPGWYWAALGLYAVGLLTKTSIVVLPVVLLGCVWWRRRRIRGMDLIYSIPFFFMSLVASYGTVWFQYNRAIKSAVVRPEGMLSRVAAAGAALWFYVYKILVPINISMIYPRWEVNPGSSFASLLWLVPGLALVACAVVVIARRRSFWARPLIFAVGYFVLCMLPVLGAFDMYFFRYSFVADHWQYLGIIGIIALVVGFADWALKTFPRRARVASIIVAAACAAVLALLLVQHAYPEVNPTAANVASPEENPWPKFRYGAYMAFFSIVAGTLGAAAWVLRTRLRSARNLGAAVGLLVAGTLFALTLDKTPIYRDEGTLWHDTIPRNPKCWIAHYNMGTFLASRHHKLLAGLPYLRMAVRLNPDYESAHNNLGLTLHQLRRSNEALPYFDRALKLKPYYPEAHFNKGLALASLGRLDEAIEYYRAALQYKKNYAQVFFSLGQAYERKGDLKEAANNYLFSTRANPGLGQGHLHLGAVLIRLHEQMKDPKLLALAEKHLRLAAELLPNNAEVALRLGLALDRQNKLNEAVQWYRKALQLRGNRYDEAHNNLGILFGKVKRLPQAAFHFEQCLRINPKHPEAWNNYGLTLAMTGKHADALKCYDNALKFKARYASAHYNKALSLKALGRLTEAAEEVKKALKFRPDYREAVEELRKIVEELNKGGATTRPAKPRAEP